jgi:hypothetical protein
MCTVWLAYRRQNTLCRLLASSIAVTTCITQHSNVQLVEKANNPRCEIHALGTGCLEARALLYWSNRGLLDSCVIASMALVHAVASRLSKFRCPQRLLAQM